MTEQYFQAARDFSQQSTCLKTRTGAVIVKNGKIISGGANICAPDGYAYGEIVDICPRFNIKTGANYELCGPVHAEVMTCLNIRPNRTQDELASFAGHLKPTPTDIIAAFTPDELKMIQGATLYLVGHYYACDGCQRFLKMVGITDIRFDPISGQATKDRYEKENLT